VIVATSRGVAIRPAAETWRGHIASLPRFRGSFFSEIRKPAGGREPVGLESEFAHPGHIDAPTVRRPSPLPDKCETFGRAFPRAAPSSWYRRANVPPEELLRAAGDSDLDLSLDFVRDALARGDMAFGRVRRRSPGRLHVAHVHRCSRSQWPVARVSHPYQYSYKGFTRPSHRRKRIHVAITSFADAHLFGAAYKFEVGYTEIDNFAAVGVADFLGRRRIGYGDTYNGSDAVFRSEHLR